MNIKEIKELAEIMKSTGLTTLEISEEGSCVKLERMPAPQLMTAQEAIPVAHAITGAEAAELISGENQEGSLVKSPTVGVFYSSPSPDSNTYVQVGSMVKTGDILCIIEAMKLMNEITADCDGEIVEILAGNGQVVEYGQPLFRIR